MVAATRPARALLALALLHVGAALDQSAWPPRPRALLATSVLEGVFRPGLRLGATRTEGAVSRHRGREQATEPTEPLGSILGPGTLVGALHVFNKALMCWCTDARVRDMVVKVADVGFLGLLGSLSLVVAFAPVGALTNIQPMILQTGLSHILLEMGFNGIAIPVLCGAGAGAEVKEAPGLPAVEGKQQGVKEAPGLPAVEGKQQGVLEAAAARSVGRRQLGLRLDIWVHHLLAVAAMFIVLQSGEFHEEATMLTAVECTCALPVAFGQAAQTMLTAVECTYALPVAFGQAAQTMLTAAECTCALPVAFGEAAQAAMLHGARSSVLGVLMVVGFAGMLHGARSSVLGVLMV
ncbi:hypothetical protein T484DRAFT_1803012, partial [Baffinella frigidus]